MPSLLGKSYSSWKPRCRVTLSQRLPAPVGRLTHSLSLPFKHGGYSYSCLASLSLWDRGPSHGRTPNQTLPDLAQWFSELSEPQDHLEGLVKHTWALAPRFLMKHLKTSLAWQRKLVSPSEHMSNVGGQVSWVLGDPGWWWLHQLVTLPFQCLNLEQERKNHEWPFLCSQPTGQK